MRAGKDIPHYPAARIAEILAPGSIEARLRAHAPSTISRTMAPKRAAVAALLRFDGASPELLLMRRATREGDRWSGHVSFPGGGEQASDGDLLATAIREAREEVGVDLVRSARAIGRLDDLMAVAKGKVLPMAITPYVFFQTGPVELVLGDEAEATLWLPLGEVLSGALSGTFQYRLGPIPFDLPCWRHAGHVIWGLTHKMIGQLVEIVSVG